MYLEPITIEALEQLSDDLVTGGEQLGISFQDVDATAAVIAQTQLFYAASGVRPPWASYLGVDETSKVAMGTCSFVHAPDPDGVVEIAYMTFPAFQGQGHATAMARQLVAIARRSEVVIAVVAHTLAEENASTKILTGLGFERTDETVDPDDGPIWRWRRRL